MESEAKDGYVTEADFVLAKDEQGRAERVVGGCQEGKGNLEAVFAPGDRREKRPAVHGQLLGELHRRDPEEGGAGEQVEETLPVDHIHRLPNFILGKQRQQAQVRDHRQQTKRNKKLASNRKKLESRRRNPNESSDRREFN